MSKRRPPAQHIRPLNPPEPSGRQKRRELAGQRAPGDQVPYFERSEVDAAEPLSQTAFDEGEPARAAEDQAEPAEPGDEELLEDMYNGRSALRAEQELAEEAEGLDLLTDLDLRAGETSDALEASDEGATYVAPIDPPVVPGSPANAEVASGLGVSALDEPYDESHHGSFLPADDEVSARVREALRADSSTSQYADTIAVETRDGVVVLRGLVEDLIDNDNLLAVASDVAGVVEVVDRLRVRSLERGA